MKRVYFLLSGVFLLPLCLQLGAETKLKYAAHLSIQRQGDATIATVDKPWAGSSATYTYVLSPKGAKRPSLAVKNALYIQTPIKSAVCLSNAYVSALSLLGEMDALSGVDSASYIYSESARERVSAGKTREVSKGLSPNLELLMALSPEAVFTYAVGNEWDSYPKLLEAGLPVIICAEWMEDSPLGRAEWIKFFGLFFGKEREAEALFEKVEKSYQNIKMSLNAKADGKRPVVLVNAPFQGAWNVSGGKSYMATLIADAGGDYLWKDDPSSGGLNLSVEAAFSAAQRATLWLNPGTTATLRELASRDSRFSGLSVFKAGQVWNSNKRILASGANDYYESSAFAPDLVLRDLSAIIAQAVPGAAPIRDSKLYFYQRLY
jgi:iron complex transport system substrate-binding protein